jgi:hypothetical protein
MATITLTVDVTDTEYRASYLVERSIKHRRLATGCN